MKLITDELRDLSKSCKYYYMQPIVLGQPLSDYFVDLANRIDKKHDEEIKSLQSTIRKLNDAIAEKQELNENSKSAQFEFCKFQRLLKAVRCLCNEVFNYMKVCNPSVAGGCELRRALENVKDALALFSNSLKNENSMEKKGGEA